MRKVLLVAINSKFIQTNLALRYIRNYLLQHNSDVTPVIKEFTINQQVHTILSEIYKEKPAVVLLSIYIWNVEFSLKIITEIKKILPGVKIITGGPEVAYRAQEIMEEYTQIDYCVEGEGEVVVSSLLKEQLPPGVYYRKDSLIINTGKALLIENPDEIPFPYLPDELELLENKIIYYESSRGCPYNCSYCISSIDKTVRFFSLERVQRDISLFLQHNVPLVKFVDRTFNLKKEHYLPIWKFIIDNHNNITTFHFEITADRLSDDDFTVLNGIGKDVIQFEVGIQTINEETLEIVARNSDIVKQREMIKKIPENIHIHLDLIAGLPKESLQKFIKSFNYTIRLKPDMMQLGFLKVLSGTEMAKTAEKEGFMFFSSPPYEIISTPDLSYEELLIIKDIEHVVDIYYNSKRFSKTIDYLLNMNDPFSLFHELKCFLEKSGAFVDAKKTTDYYLFLYLYLKENHLPDICIDLLKFDFISYSPVKSFPEWYNRMYDKDVHHHLIKKYAAGESTRSGFINTNYEVFNHNPFTLETLRTELFFIYENGTCITIIENVKNGN
ncbi:MAG: hypothetical protein A2015_08335 [Spirochaetes bacterium GWF1_31_7]|nr:MAG: hypothetical protein A2Y30_08530 [Spirochaetes bacterium GWE1_32_154]OHD47155.1 MAG: hypothetical protein A2015_08335 [Spirochaetes bacterium GWF1_31_7]OHD47465.1 MAG: hypothetical protein A2Y29_08755 [Spirochaetes bacterium GWE2_31_10]OHD82743.1 MAG: hypothetical protein A2355_04680 [Spirochaetes bacterium RIFOXYB1_FULL_32_8]HBD94950.1 B12-binding domain-containing radical SAM protein [Spirochaetia bacterium]